MCNFYRKINKVIIPRKLCYRCYLSFTLLCLLPQWAFGNEKLQLYFLLDNTKTLYTNMFNSIKKQLNEHQFNSKLLLIDNRLEHHLQQADLIISFGSKATEKALELNNDKAILATLISHADYQTLKSVFKKQAFMALTLEQPLRRQLHSIRQLLPHKKRLAILLHQDSLYDENQLKQLASSVGFQQIHITHAKNIEQAMTQAIHLLNNNDIFLALNDTRLMNRYFSKQLTTLAFIKKKVVIGFSPAFIRSGGLAAIYSSNEQIARYTTELINNWAKNKTFLGVLHRHQKYYTISVNHSVKNHFSLHIAPSIEGIHDD